MLFQALAPQRFPKAQLSEDFATARIVGRARLGKHCIYFKRFFRYAYLPYTAIYRVWVREEKIPGGGVSFYHPFLIVADHSGAMYWSAIPSVDLSDEIFAIMTSHNPDLKPGYPEKE